MAKKILTITIVAVFAGIFLKTGFASAQQAPQLSGAGPLSGPPEFMASWQARSYTPNWYQGKILPTFGSLIDVSFELIDKGKIVDLSKTIVRWYVDDNLKMNEENGLGIKHFALVSEIYGNDDIKVRITIPDYKGSVIDEVIIVPSKNPEAVINFPSYKNQLKRGENKFIVSPFFFNVKDLKNFSYSWTIDGETEATSKEEAFSVLNLNIDETVPLGTIINLEAVIKNLADSTEVASKSLKLEFK